MDSPQSVCGVDEAGRGPVLGPMVMSLVCADPGILRAMGAKDSKTLTRSRREYLFDRIEKEARQIEYIVISAGNLNVMMNDKTLNEIELEHAIKLISLSDGDVVVDCFDVNESRASDIMSKRTGRNVRCIHKADRDYPAVSAASIVSKVIRDREIDRIKEKYGNVGSGYPADPVTREFLENAIREGRDLEDIVRVHWSTFKNMKKKARSGKLF